MSNFIINITNGASKGTIQTKDFSYTDKLNLTDEAIINVPGSGSSTRSLIATGAEVEVYRDSTLEFLGNIIGVTYLNAGGISLRCKDFTFGSSKKKTTAITYSATASATIFTALINTWSASYLGTIATGIDLDFRIENSSSIASALSNLRKKTDQDIEKVYSTQKVNIVDHKGSTTSVLTFNDYIDISNLGYDFQEPVANKITVYGKGDGENQIVSDSAQGQNATSISAYGEIEKTERDLTIVSVSEANILANILADKYGPQTKSYTFRVNNPNQTLVSGDVITLVSKEKELDAEEVRIVGIKRGVRGGSEFLEMEVSNAEYSELLKSTNRQIGDLQLSNNDSQTYMQGTTNVLTFSEMINANNTAPLRVKAYLPDEFIKDEVGNLRVNQFTIDYDIDPFRSGVGTASETDVAPSLSGGETDSHKHDASDSGHDHTNSTQTSSANWIGDDEGSDSGSSVSCSSGSWTTVASEYVGSAANTSVSFYVRGDSGGAEDISVRIRNSGFAHYVDADCQFGIYMDGFRDVSFLEMGDISGGPCSSDTISLQVYPHTGAIDVDAYIGIYEKAHTHSISSWDVSDENANVSDSNKTPGLSGNAASHNHSVSIGDGVSDSGSTNATSVSIYLDFWNGTAWINKHSIINTGKTIDFDVDISDSGTYPDTEGFWRARVLSNNATPDLFQATIKCVHELDS